VFDWANAMAKWGKLGEASDNEDEDAEEEDNNEEDDGDDDDYEDDNHCDDDHSVDDFHIPFENLTNMAPPKRPRTSIEYTKSGYTEMDEQGVEAALFCLAEAEFGATTATYNYQVQWLKRGGNNEPKPINVDGGMAQVWYKNCAFHNSSGCKFCLRVVKRLDAAAGKEWSIELGNQQHNNHEQLQKEASRGIKLPIIMKYMSKPEQFSMKPSQIVASIRKDNVTVSKKMEKAIKKCATRIRTNHNLVISGATSLKEADSFGVLYTAVMQCTRDGIAAAGMPFDHNTIFVVGGDCIFEPEADKFAVVVSSENFLMNAYRQSKSGQPALLCLDMSFRYTHEKVGLYVIVTVASGSSPGRKLIAYGIFSKENGDFQQWAIARVKKEIDSIAARDSDFVWI
jgi:hypothetical protein